MESIMRLRQMMAEQKYFEVQKLVEAQLLLVGSARPDLLQIYCEALKAQEKIIPTQIAIELIEEDLKLKNYSKVLEIINSFNKYEQDSYFLKLALIKINVFKDTGRNEDLYRELSSILIQLFEHQIPSIPKEVEELSNQFFKNDFHLGILKLSFALLVNNIHEAEVHCRNLIITCMEKSSVKGIKEKLNLISEILRPARDLMPLKMYQNFCEVHVSGAKGPKEIKKIIEMVIFFEDFVFQAHILNLLVKFQMTAAIKPYAAFIKLNKEYSFVYFDKYLPELKKVYIQERPQEKKPEIKKIYESDLKVDDRFISDIVSADLSLEKFEGAEYLKTLIKYQDFTSSELCDLSVGFIQSEMPDIALVAANEAVRKATTPEENLKGSYLKLNIYLMLKDYRAAQDTCLKALVLASTENDILSFLYGQAEALIRLDDKREARNVLKRILQIDQKYRLAKERLDKLNEI